MHPAVTVVLSRQVTIHSQSIPWPIVTLPGMPLIRSCRLRDTYHADLGAAMCFACTDLLAPRSSPAALPWPRTAYSSIRLLLLPQTLLQFQIIVQKPKSTALGEWSERAACTWALLLPLADGSTEGLAQFGQGGPVRSTPPPFQPKCWP